MYTFEQYYQNNKQYYFRSSLNKAAGVGTLARDPLLHSSGMLFCSIREDLREMQQKPV